jgi:hypothetical protein
MALAPAAGQADTEARIVPYKLETADRRHVFVMARSCFRGSDVREEAIDGYTMSGLYRNDGTRTPLWTVDWCGGVWLPSDGIHLVRSGGWASFYEGEAFSFFSRGELLHTYEVRDLVDFPRLLPHSVSHFRWLRSIEAEGGAHVYPLQGHWQEPAGEAKAAPTRHADRVRVETLHGDRYVLALETGTIVSSHRPLRQVARGLGVVVALVWIAYVVVASRRRPRLRVPHALRLIRGSLILGWALTALPLFVALILYWHGLGMFTSARATVAEGVWRLFVRVPYEGMVRLLGSMPQLAMGVPELLMVAGFWTLVAAPIGAGTAFAVFAAAAARGRGAQPAPIEPGRTGSLKRTASFLVAGFVSLVLLDGASFFAPGMPAKVLAALAVAGPLALLLVQARAARNDPGLRPGPDGVAPP